VACWAIAFNRLGRPGQHLPRDDGNVTLDVVEALWPVAKRHHDLQRPFIPTRARRTLHGASEPQVQRSNLPPPDSVSISTFAILAL
jgi:hypothetical protein